MSRRIGMVAPISHPYPPEGYGPWERVTHDLTEGLVAMGHDVTLFAAAGSSTSARLVDTVEAPLSLRTDDIDPRLEEEMHLAVAMETAMDGVFDLVHSHLHVHGLVYSRMIPCPLVTTLHGAAWNEVHHPLLLRYRNSPFVSISDAERLFLPQLNYVATVPNGIRVAEITPGEGDGGYLAFVGRMAPEKAPDLALEVAQRAGLPLRMAGPIEPQYQPYFDSHIRPALENGAVEYLGELRRSEVAKLLGGAQACVMPLLWDEPFGLVVVESLAAGTPVVAWRRGAMAEILEHGISGFLVDGVEDAVAAVERAPGLERDACRRRAEAAFSDTAMADGYDSVYSTLAGHSM